MSKRPSAIRVEGAVAYITLTRGLETAIDLADLGLAQSFRWAALVGSRGHAYAHRMRQGKMVLLHREILAAPAGSRVDHVDGDGLNNRRSNLRFCTAAENTANSVVERRKRLAGYRGVTAHRRKFRAQIKTGERRIYLGSFATAEEAAAAYKGAARLLWGEFVRD